MTYQQTLDYLFTRLPMFSRIGAAAFKKDLTNTIKLCEVLGDPHKKFKSVHIAGTNGKGSVSHMLAAILQSAGYKTGLYTSPHLKDFRERIKVNGKMVSEQFVIDFTQRMKGITEEIEPSFFELTVAMTFEYFAEQQIDVAVIETGLGGRLDSTNVIIPELAVITNIGWDHMNMLGNSLEMIAFEKAGIIKNKIPVVIGEALTLTRPIFDKVSAEKQAPIVYAEEIRFATNWDLDIHQLDVEVARKNAVDHKQYQLDLTGIYQVKNLITVLEACSQLEQSGWKINEENIRHGLQHAKKLTGLHGRWEIMQKDPMVVLDVAHNEDGIMQLKEQIELMPYRKLHIIIGMVRDKEIDHILALLPHAANYYFTQAQIPRALAAEELKKKGNALGLKGEQYPDVNIALTRAKDQAHKDDMIIVCGSVFLVGEVNI